MANVLNLIDSHKNAENCELCVTTMRENSSMRLQEYLRVLGTLSMDNLFQKIFSWHSQYIGIYPNRRVPFPGIYLLIDTAMTHGGRASLRWSCPILSIITPFLLWPPQFFTSTHERASSSIIQLPAVIFPNQISILEFCDQVTL